LVTKLFFPELKLTRRRDTRVEKRAITRLEISKSNWFPTKEFDSILIMKMLQDRKMIFWPWVTPAVEKLTTNFFLKMLKYLSCVLRDWCRPVVFGTDSDINMMGCLLAKLLSFVYSFKKNKQIFII
jgi:hypothetical protein